MDQIDHFLHRHPLMLTEMEKGVNDGVDCSGCEQVLAGPVYGCSDCKFYLHKSCAKLPEEISNFFHPCPLVLNIIPWSSQNYTCNACFERGSGFSYRCKRCKYNMHVKCALRPTMKSEGEELIHHFTHWHPLTLVDQKKDLQVRCGICGKLCSDSSDSSGYGCKECDFFLHKSCMVNIPREINNFFHPSCPLVLLTDVPYKCHGCDEPGSGLAFRCGKCDFQLDVKCALLPSIESKGAVKIQHIAHQHPLLLRESKEFGSAVRCRACGKSCLLDPCFGCNKRSCDFFLHTSCAELPQQIHHPFHPRHSLTLASIPPGRRGYTCRACLSIDSYLLTYQCYECNWIGVQVDCARLTPSVEYEGHAHLLTFFDKTSSYFFCRLCGRKGKNFWLRCVACNFNIHLYCLPSVPKTINHRCHLHPLTLTTTPLQFELNSPEDEYSGYDDFYCDVCEEKRCKFESVYYCSECKFIAEIRCVISKSLLLSVTSEDKTVVSSTVFPRDEENSAINPALTQLDELIAKHSATAEPLKAEIEKLEARLQALKHELEPITSALEELKADRFLRSLQPKHNLKEYKYSNKASSSGAMAGDQS